MMIETNKIEKIKSLIKSAEIESAKAEGMMENIKKQWKQDYGTDDVDEIKKKMDELERQIEDNESKMKSMYNKLVSSYDWDSLEKELR